MKLNDGEILVLLTIKDRGMMDDEPKKFGRGW